MTHYTYTPKKKKKKAALSVLLFLFFTPTLCCLPVLFCFHMWRMCCTVPFFSLRHTHTHTLLGLVGNCGVSQVSQVCQSASFHPPLSSQSPLGWLFNYSTCSRTKPCRVFFLYVFYSLIKIYINAAGSMKQAVHMLGLIEPLIRPWLIRVGCGSSLK